MKVALLEFPLKLSNEGIMIKKLDTQFQLKIKMEGFLPLEPFGDTI